MFPLGLRRAGSQQVENRLGWPSRPSIKSQFAEVWEILASARAVGGRLDLEPAEVGSAIRGRTYCERFLEDVAGSRKAGVHGTSTFFVGGERLVGHWRQLAQGIPAALREQQP